jgi:uncharacterized repeat protein (TIGR01451 family)
VPLLIAALAVVGAIATNSVLSASTAGATVAGYPAVPSAGSLGPDSGCTDSIGCSTGNPVQTYAVTKTASESTAVPGDKVTYTITVTNTGTVAYAAANPAAFSDDLTKVLDDATYNANATSTSGTLTYSSPDLTWSGALAVGAVATITYSVTVNSPDTGDLNLVNAIVTTNPGGDCLSGSTNSGCSSTVADVPASGANAETITNSGLAFTGVAASSQIGIGLIGLALGIGFMLLARRRRHSS